MGPRSYPASFLSVMQKLQALPVRCVVRLCTASADLLDYWNLLEQQLGDFEMEVIEDGKAWQVHRHNSWVTYGQPLQAVHELGLSHPLIDRLADRRLTPSEIHQLCELLFGCQLPDPHLDSFAFVEALERELLSAPHVFSPVKLKAVPWVNLEELGRFLSPKCLERMLSAWSLDSIVKCLA